MTSPEGKYEQELREEQEQEGLVVRDRRRIDPETGVVREPAQEPAPGSPEAAGDAATGPAAGEQSGQEAPGGAGAAGDTSGESADLAEQVASLQAQLSDALADTQRVHAEYANYRKRVERDRSAVREQALANVLGDLLPVLDDIGRAREHGELEGGFRQVGESLEGIATKLGLVQFGEAGDPFDPTIHEALMHNYSAEVTETTCAQVLQPGYALNERVLRPARVAVVEPQAPETEGSSQAAGQADPEAGQERENQQEGEGAVDETARNETTES